MAGLTTVAAKATERGDNDGDWGGRCEHRCVGGSGGRVGPKTDRLVLLPREAGWEEGIEGAGCNPVKK